MRTNTKKILGAVAVAGLVSTAGSAFTGSGLSRETGFTENDSVGGTATQTVTGAELSGVTYNLSSTDGNKIESVDITLVSALNTGQTATVVVTRDSVASDSYDCVFGSGTTYNCAFTVESGVDSLAITVGNANVPA